MHPPNEVFGEERQEETGSQLWRARNQSHLCDLTPLSSGREPPTAIPPTPVPEGCLDRCSHFTLLDHHRNLAKVTVLLFLLTDHGQ